VSDTCLPGHHLLQLTILLGPGHFLEVEKILPLLTSPSSEHPSFHVVAPSLAGFGFSEQARKGGFGLHQHAEARIDYTICHFLNLDVCIGMSQAHAGVGLYAVWYMFRSMIRLNH
jgi:hypothetical protein